MPRQCQNWPARDRIPDADCHVELGRGGQTLAIPRPGHEEGVVHWAVEPFYINPGIAHRSPQGHDFLSRSSVPNFQGRVLMRGGHVPAIGAPHSRLVADTLDSMDFLAACHVPRTE